MTNFSLKEAFWPSVSDIAGAKRASIVGAGWIFSTVVIIYLLRLVLPGPSISVENVLMFVIHLFICWGVYKSSRVASIFGLILFLIGMIENMLIGPPIKNFGLLFLIIIGFANGIRGAFAYHGTIVLGQQSRHEAENEIAGAAKYPLDNSEQLKPISQYPADNKQDSATAYCSSCGNKASEGAVFCSACGSRLSLPNQKIEDAIPKQEILMQASGSSYANMPKPEISTKDAISSGSILSEESKTSIASPSTAKLSTTIWWARGTVAVVVVFVGTFFFLGEYDKYKTGKEASEWYEKGNGLRDSRQNIPAIEAYSKALNLKPEYREAYISRGRSYEREGRYQDAINDFNKAINLNPYDAEAYGYRGISYRNVKNYEQALKDLNRAIELAPQLPIGYIERGRVYIDLKNNSDACQRF